MTPHSTTDPTFDWQGHRGARGLLPENTIPAFLRALSYPDVTTLELDVVISGDDRVIVSHDPYMEPEFCSTPTGGEITDTVRLRELTVTEIATYDCGQRAHPRFPEQQSRPASKPTLAAVFAAVDRYCVQQGRDLPRYNIELKYQPEWQPSMVPDREAFARLVLADVADWGHPELVNLQCFDPPMLAVIHELAPDMPLAYLDESPGEVALKMERLGFVPEIYSPWERGLTAGIVAEARSLNMRIIPWTVNDVARMRELIDLGVDGIITDYPNRIEHVNR
ncbi:glycerophosphoryl diester phosphodiesterase [Neolewinella xylanilytica]|uniref:Glycerophosphoryl diester phosphodiesterase n=1 Tax=Neolewinella xylanilytica TaxID=1514080 RepID=A0A2S6I5F2_9BACT|nr:glycerophosphodiester phosphodiesterase family protein [Neolewinella xylanilytica]PPK86404.1 glycerophosphoryl diester phosphodiesterase [Neolewinella xylanilytica]